MILGFTGTRSGLAVPQRKALARWLMEAGRPAECRHGDCTGADEQFHSLVLGLFPGLAVVGHPPDRPGLRAFCSFAREEAELPYLERNRAIARCCDVLLACPKEMEEIRRSGTWSCVREGRRRGKRIVLVLPDGSVMEEAGR